MSINEKFYDTHTLYVTSGVAREDQLLKTLYKFIEDADNVLGYNTNCQVKVNLIVSRNGEYFGFGYIFVSSEEIYWMLLGKNPDGTERIEEYPDPDWKPPETESKSFEELLESGKSWYEKVLIEDSFIQPILTKQLPPLVELSGYEYDEDQYLHLRDIEIEKGENPDNVPKIGYFELSRAYAKEVEFNKMPNVLCARSVPDWIPETVFKSIFKLYAEDSNSKFTKIVNNKKTKDTYPSVKIIEGKKNTKGKIVFITFDPKTKNALFALLMTRKLRIKHPKDPTKKCTLIFDHAYDHMKKLHEN